MWAAANMSVPNGKIISGSCPCEITSARALGLRSGCNHLDHLGDPTGYFLCDNYGFDNYFGVAAGWQAANAMLAMTISPARASTFAIHVLS
jgi:hypothetical protein